MTISEGIDIYLADCLDTLRLLPPSCVDCVVTDPPYRTITGGDSGDRPQGMLGGNRLLFKHQNDIAIKDWFPILYHILKDDTQSYVFTNCLNLNKMWTEAEAVGFKVQNLLVWEKNNKTPSQYYMKNCEYVLLLRKGRAKYINNIGNSNTVHKFNNIIGVKNHPCEKPVDLLRFYIENSTKCGDLVLDPFMGGGSCGSASIQCGRRFIGIEKDPQYFAVAKERIEREISKPKQELLGL